MAQPFYILVLILGISSCSSPETNENLDTNPDNEPNISVTIQTNFLKSGAHDITYFSFTKNVEGSFSSFIYSRDSSLTSESIMWRTSLSPKSLEYYPFTLTAQINSSNDTLFLNEAEQKEHGFIGQYKYILKDSFDLKLENDTFIIYSYSRIDENIRWDETLYFSNEYGLLFTHYNYFQNNKETIQHGNIEVNQLRELISQLKTNHKKGLGADANYSDSIVDSLIYDFNSNGIPDQITIYGDNHIPFGEGPESARTMVLEIDGKQLWEKDSIVLCTQCGGAYGDPFAQILFENDTLKMYHYGGSGWRWGFDQFFIFEKNLVKFKLVLERKFTFHSGDPEETYEERMTSIDKLEGVYLSEINNYH
ncbi:MAG: hypothetical protein COA33_005455 [Fluviicola sp.]|nr:hypothetical protein [Fluviicola sp.]